MKLKSTLIISFLMLSFSAVNAQDSGEQAELKFIIKTNYGDIKIKLYNDTPLHRDNFVKLVREGWYNNSIFHRVINAFMIQGGWNSEGVQDPGYTVPAEIIPNHFHKKGALAAARMPDQINPEKESSGSQFYIVQGRTFADSELNAISQRSGHNFTEEEKEYYRTIGGTPHLDGAYTVFGEVTEGLDVVDKIAAVQTGVGDKPKIDVTFSIIIDE